VKKIRHLIDTTDLSNKEIEEIFKDADHFLNSSAKNLLKDRLIITIFFENSTRTRSSFEVAAKRLGAQVVSLDVSRSSTKKGETLFDTAANLDAMGPNAIIVRHKNAGVPKILSNYVKCSLINGGDGAHAHPSQALLDLYTIKKYIPNLDGKKIAIVGDIKNSRVANSNIELLTRFKMEITLVAPPHFLPRKDIKFSYSLKDIIDEVDVIMSLRTQTERHKLPIYASLKDYASNFCITKELIKDKNLIILHPGPVHRNIDIDDEVLKDPRCKVLEQVKNGVAIRMAILKKLILDNG